METLAQLNEEYRTALEDYLEGAGEAALQRAYELGRRAVDEGMGLLDLAEIYRDALTHALARIPLPDPAALTQSAAAFFAESLSPFEITHRSFREAAAALRIKEQRYRELFENAGDMVFTLDLEGRLTSINRAGEEFTGYLRNEIFHISFPDLLAPEHQELSRRMLEQEIAGGGPAMYEAEILSKGGRRMAVEVKTRLLFQGGLPVAVQGNARDITERKRARETEERLRLVVEGVKDYAIIMLDPEGRIATWNEGAQRIKGYAAEEIIGRNFSCLYPPEEVRAGVPRQNLEKARAEGRSESEGWRIRRDGSRFWANVVLTALRDPDGCLRGFAKVTRDLTERYRAEEALRRMNEALEVHAQRVAHALHDESGQLLASLHIALEEAAREAPPALYDRFEHIKGLLDQVEEQLRHLSHELRPTILDDLGLAAALQYLADGVSRRTGISVAVECTADVRFPPSVEMVLYRAVQESLTNVTRHAKASRVAIAIRREPVGIRCSISDDGKGFDPAPAPAPKGGRGLGLTGIQARIEALSGTLQIHSRPQGGTELVITIPLGS